MKKTRLRRAVSFILALVMTLSLFSVPGFSGTASAAPETLPSSDTARNTPDPLTQAFEVDPFNSASTDVTDTSEKPTLYIDFLGDNVVSYTYPGTSGYHVPSDLDQSYEQKRDGVTPNGPWKRYGADTDSPSDCTPTVPGTVFWVGVGIDKMTLMELAKDGRGLTGLELGFYYNTEFVAPWTGSNQTDSAANYAPDTTPGAYAGVLANENLSNSPNPLNQWDARAYEIVDAVVERDVVMEDATTQEDIFAQSPTNDDMRGANWKMLYVSLEKKTTDWGGTDWKTANRFSDATTAGDSNTNYVMMLPFVLKKYDPKQKICFRLARNASVMSVGGGKAGGGNYDSANDANSAFGAWERQTRTPRHNLKEMFTFEGDLNIFTGANQPDTGLKATLSLIGKGTHPNNAAKIYSSDDPSIYVDTDKDSLTGLVPGDQVTLETVAGPGIVMAIAITTVGGSVLSYTEVTPGSKYTFIMPNEDARVTVTYRDESSGPSDDYQVELIIVEPVPVSENYAKITGTASSGMTGSADTNHGTIKVKAGNTVDILAQKHPDYKMTIEVKTKAGTDVTWVQLTPEEDHPDDYQFTMPEANTEVIVTYEKLPMHIAELSVDAVSDVDPANKAKLSFDDYSTGAATPTNRFVDLNGQTGGRKELGPIPAQRTVTLDIALLEPEYMVSEIRLYHGDDSGNYDPHYDDLLPLLTAKPTDPEGYNKTLTVTMPDHRIQVYVVFAKARNYTARLFLQNGSSAEMSGYYHVPDAVAGVDTYNKTDMTATPTRKNTILVWPTNTVEVELKPAYGYEVVSVTFKWGSNTREVIPTPGQTTVTHTMPAADLDVFVKFKSKDRYNATLNFVNGINGYVGNQTGWPKDPTATPVVLDWPTKYNIVEGDTSTAWIQVRPGWYIANVRVVGRDTSGGPKHNTGSGNGYPVASLSGNGYNNGNGGRVTLKVDQPAESITVYVDMRQGLPPVEPPYSLTLQVDDPASLPPGSQLNNWAQVSIAGGAYQPTPPTQQTVNNNYIINDVTAGQLIRVHFNADMGYFVTGVTVTPSGFSVVPTWTGADEVEFYMPAGSAVATVHFAEKDITFPYVQAHLHISGANPAESVTLTNDLTTMFTDVDGGTVGAWPGDGFTTSVVTSRYVTVKVYREGGGVIAWTGTNGNGSFVMQDVDAHVYVTFRDTPPDPNEHTLAVTAVGPTGTAQGEAGEVALTVAGAAKGTAESNDLNVPTLMEDVREGKNVVLDITPKLGFVVERIEYTPAGATSPVELAAPSTPAGSRKVRFAMPGVDTAVVVYFKAGTPGEDDAKHTANIILRMDGSTDAVNTAVVGDAQFDPDGGYSKVATAGTPLSAWAIAKDGYYISKVEITPKTLEMQGDVSGVFASQNIYTVMPDADCFINVYFKRGWPGEAELMVNLRVHGPGGVAGNNAQLFNVTQDTQTAAPITAGGRQSLRSLVDNLMTVKIKTEAGYTLAHPISVKDSMGNDIPYWWSGDGQISFQTPNTWVNVDVTFEPEDPTDPYEYNATLFNKTSGSTTKGILSRAADGTNTGAVNSNMASMLTGLTPGETLRVEIRDVPAGKIPVLWVQTANGVEVPFAALTQTGGVYETQFYMQDDDVEVYLTEADQPDPNLGEYLATLVVKEYGAAGAPETGNWAEMKDAALGTATGPVNVVGMANIKAADGNTVTIDATPVSGYAVRSVVVTDEDGNTVTLHAPTAATPADHYSFAMPGRAVTAVVTFEKYDAVQHPLTAQVVVDNGGGNANKAVLRRAGSSDPGVTKLEMLAPGDRVEVDITVQSGYRIQLVRARADNGRVVGVTDLTALPEASQSVSFTMPSDDVVVFVRFVSNDPRRRIIMDVTDHTAPTPNMSNYATLYTGYSGLSGNKYHGDTAVAEGTPGDVVTVTAYPQTGYYAVVSAVYEGTSTGVPDLTVDHTDKVFTFSVPNSDVHVKVDFYPDSVPKPKHNVTLYVIGPAGVADVDTYCVTDDTYVLDRDTLPLINKTSIPTVMTIPVDYLNKVAVKGTAKSGYYIQGAYAMVGTTMLSAIPGTTSPNPLGTKDTQRQFDFKMQNADVSVYVVITDTELVGPYTAALTVTGPYDADWLGNPVVGAAGSAVLTNTRPSPTVSTGVVGSNKAYDPITDAVNADHDDQLQLEVTVNPGYSIDMVTVTPLSLNLYPSSVVDMGGGVRKYIYVMPSANIAINVRLKDDGIDRYKVTLHLDDACPNVPSDNRAKVSYTVYELETDGAWMNVPDAQYVKVEAEAAAGYYIHHAYAVTEKGEVLPLINVGHAPPPNPVIDPLQANASTGVHPNADNTAWFIMPKENVDVYIQFTTTPPKGTYSAILTVLDDDPTHASKATMSLTRSGGNVQSIEDTSLPGHAALIGINSGETLVVTLNIATGYELDEIVVTGGLGTPGSIKGDGTTAGAPVPVKVSDTQYTFVMPAYDVGVVVKLKSVTVDGYTATLHIVDHSSAMGNGVVMKEQTTTGMSVNTNGGSISGLNGNETIETTVTPAGGVIVRAVLATDGTGTRALSLTGGQYDYVMNNHDVDITVILDNDDPGRTPEMFVAYVEKTGNEADNPGNTAVVTNTSNPALPRGDIWTGIYGEDPSQRLRVDVTTLPGYTATITARTKDGSGADVDIPVLQLGIAGVVTGYLDVPHQLWDNVIITVDYSDTRTPAQHTLELDIVDPNNNSGNTAQIKQGSTMVIDVNGLLPTTASTPMAEGTALELETAVSVGHMVKAELISNGISVTLTLNSSGSSAFVMPTSDAQVVVTLAQGQQTPRPHDNLQDPTFPGGSKPISSYKDGYLIGENLGGNTARVSVPNLFGKDLTPTTVPAYDSPDREYEYKLYLKAGENYVELIPGVDYDVTIDGSYDPGAANATTGVTPHSDTGWQFQIRSLKGESALTELMLSGGVLYITATDVTDPANPLDESEYVEVTLPADPRKGKFQAMLKIVDSSGVTGNQARMSDGKVTVSGDGDCITKLVGDELIRTQAHAEPGARISAVTVTDSGGTRLLTEVPLGEDPQRFPYYMQGEDIIITVYFEAEKDPDNPDSTHYIAAVSKYGATAVSGNDAEIKNGIRNNLLRGTIWAEGNENDTMVVTVSVAPGYYATLRAYNKWTGDPVVVTAFGAGAPGFEAKFNMPAADVQVEITWTRDAPEDLFSDLTLMMKGDYGAEPDNLAKMACPPGSSTYALEVDTTVLTDTETGVEAGTLFDLVTGHSPDYYIEKVIVKVYNNTPETVFTLPLDIEGMYTDFAMPLGKTEVEVWFKKTATEPRTPRPYDPMHSEDYNSPAYVTGSAADLSNPSQAGWIMAMPLDPLAGQNRVQVLVPTLHDDEEPVAANALEDAPAISAAMEYKYYWKDGFNVYHELVKDVDVKIEGTVVTDAYGTFDGFDMTLTALKPGSILDYYIRRGGMIYVTSNKAPGATPSQESGYTQVVIPRLFIATLHHRLVESGKVVPGTGARMDASGGTPDFVTGDGDQITKLLGSETVTTNNIICPPGYKVVGVVATTVQGTVNVVEDPAGEYTYQMVQEDVDIYVVYDKDDNPLEPKGPYIATVYKVDDGGLAGNTATITDTDVVIPSYQKGTIWTAAYYENVVRVDVNTEPGWYALITAKTADAAGNPVTVTQFVAGTNSYYGLFIMPEADVDVTVKYVHGPLPTYDLRLLMQGNYGGQSSNRAQLELEGGSEGTLTVTGTSTSDFRSNVTPGWDMHLITETHASYRVEKAYMIVDGNTAIEIDIPLTDGDSLPDPLMPMGNTDVIVRYQTGAKTARPYDPAHANPYNSAYNHNTADDLSQTHQDGWILGQRRGDKRFVLTIPTLHDEKNKAADPRGSLYNAGDIADQPQYKLYWRNALGVFQELVVGTDITVTDAKITGVYQDAATGINYDNYTLDISITPDPTNPDPTYPHLWGGYTLWQYLMNGGSIYVTATGGASGVYESEKTEVVFPRTDTYTATLHHSLVDTTTGMPVTPVTNATMTVPSIPMSVTGDGDDIGNLEGDELVTVQTTDPAGYHVVGVVATTASGSVNVPYNGGMAQYEYTMNYEDVDLYVVYDKDDNPLKPKGPHIATVYKVGDEGVAGNDATIKDLDVTIPDHQKGNIWTAAYEDNVVRVDVSTAPGWYASITAETVSGTTLSVAQFVVDANNFYGLFYMAGEDVNVTVTYSQTPPDDWESELYLQTVNTASVLGNSAQLEADGLGSQVIDGVDDVQRVPDNTTLVPAGTTLKLTTNAAPGYSVKSAEMTVAGITVDVPLTDGKSVPDMVMPIGEATVTVTYEPGDKTPRPYDPDHANGYKPPYPTVPDNPDLSETGQEGWILASEIDADNKTFTIHVPTLHDNKGAAPGTLYNAGDIADPDNEAAQPEYKLYWRDSMGKFQPLVRDVDYTVTYHKAEGSYTNPNDGSVYDGYTLKYKLTEDIGNSADPHYPTLWGGYTVWDYMRNGGSLYITATGTAPDARESEKTEVVFPAESVRVTLHIVNHSSAPVPGSVLTTDDIHIADADGEYFLTGDDAVIKTTVTTNPGVVIRSVIATTASGGSQVLTLTGGEYLYTMEGEDVDITVVFDNEDPIDPDNPDVPKMYLAIVEKAGDDVSLVDNTVSITNLSNPALPGGEVWTGIYAETPQQRVRVDFTTAMGYCAVVTAATNLAGASVNVPVVQLGSTGSGLAYVDIPSVLEDNVIITVTYYRTAPTDQYELSLELVDPAGAAGNTALLATTPALNGTGAAPMAGPVLMTGGESVDLTYTVSAGYLDKVEIVSGGMRVLVDATAVPTPIHMPYADATVVVTLAAGQQTPRPHDGLYDPTMGGTKVSGDYINGHLVADNLSGNRALIQVPNLFDAGLSPNCIPAYDEPDKKYDYKLYLDVGGKYAELIKGVDYDVTWDGSYIPADLVNVTTGVQPHDDTGWAFKLRSLQGESALTELLLDGGVLYITATDVTDPANILAESEYVEVHVPADPNKPDDDPSSGYKATLRVVDNSEVPNNTAEMYIDGHPGVTYLGDGSIFKNDIGDTTHLRGDEQVRTTAEAAPGARISAVTATTAGGGTILLTEIPPRVDPKRFPHYMTGEDVIITVYFEKQENTLDPDDPEDTRYIAAVAKYGAVDVPNNDATIANVTPAPADRSSFASGDIWQEGYETDKMQVTVTLAEGYYAQVKATRMDNGSSYTITVNAPGPGPGVGPLTTFTVDFDMPASDVQVDVTFTRALDDDLRPYDPDTTGNANYADHWITSENRGDRLVVIVPMLNKEDGSDPTEVDKTMHTFQFQMAVNGADPESLDQIIVLSHPDPNDTSGDPYENEIYYADPTTPAGTEPDKYHGARFVLQVLSDEEIDQAVTDGTIADGDAAKKLAALLRAIMDNAGTDEAITNGLDLDLDGDTVAENYKCRLYITHTEDNGADPAYTSPNVDFEIPRYYAFRGILESYAPKHTATFSLYPLMEGATDPTDDTQYEAEPFLSYELTQTWGTDLWEQDFSVKSSDLMGRDRLGRVYKLVVAKPGHVTYCWLGLELSPSTLDDPAELTFTLDPAVNGGMIALIGGDLNDDGASDLEDLGIISDFMGGGRPYTRGQDPNDATTWDTSVYNPESLAYAADLDGNGKLSASDLSIMNNERNYRKNAYSYMDVMPQLINGTTGVILYGLDEEELAEELDEELLDKEDSEEEDKDHSTTYEIEPDTSLIVPETTGKDHTTGKTESASNTTVKTDAAEDLKADDKNSHTSEIETPKGSEDDEKQAPVEETDAAEDLKNSADDGKNNSTEKVDPSEGPEDDDKNSPAEKDDVSEGTEDDDKDSQADQTEHDPDDAAGTDTPAGLDNEGESPETATPSDATDTDQIEDGSDNAAKADPPAALGGESSPAAHLPSVDSPLAGEETGQVSAAIEGLGEAGLLP